MKKQSILLIVLFLSLTRLSAQTKAGKTDSAYHKFYYTCTHTTAVANRTKGNCPKCLAGSSLSAKEKMKAEISRNNSYPVQVQVSTHNDKCPKRGSNKITQTPKEQMKSEVMRLYICCGNEKADTKTEVQ